MSYQVYILEDAEQDIKDIYFYVAYNDSKTNALKLIDELEAACFTLDNLPERGIVPHELKEIGVIDYLQIICFSYRIIYQIDQQQVFIHAVLDGRRDMPSLLETRFLR
mgnify:FL=1